MLRFVTHSLLTLPGSRVPGLKAFSHSFFLLAALCILSVPEVSGQVLYNQTFGTSLALSSNTSTTTGTYCSATPSTAQLNAIVSNGTGASYSVPSGTQRLTLARTGNAVALTRSSNFSPAPQAMVLRFDLIVTGNPGAADNAASIAFGQGFSQAVVGEEAPSLMHSRLGINFSATAGSFSLRNGTNTASSSDFSGSRTIYYVMNNSGGPVSYLGPDGSLNTVDNDLEDVWVGSSLVFNEDPAVTGTASLENLKVAFAAGQGTVELDNILVSLLPAAPVTPGSQLICQAATPTVSQLQATGTGIKWYTAQTGGTALAGSSPVSTGSYWASQTLGQIESHRSLLNVVVSNVDISANTISSAQSVCANRTPAGLTGSVPVILNGSGIFAYQWEVSLTSSTTGFSAMPGENGQNYTFSGPVGTTRWFRRVVSSDGCSNQSAAVQITVTPALSNAIGAGQSLCAGATAAALTGVPTGGTGVYTYVWISSTTSATSGYSVVSGQTSQTLSPGILAATTWFRRIVNSGVCGPDTSNAVQVEILPVITGNTIGVNQTLCSGTVPDTIRGATPTGGNGTYTYAWQVSTTAPGTTGYTSTGITNPYFSFLLPIPTTAWYRRVTTSGACTSTSPSVQLTISPVLSGNTISAAQTICSGAVPNSFTGSAVSGGIAPITYTWESSTTSASAGFSAIAGATSQNYASPALTQTTWFRRVATGGPCPALTSNTIQVTVDQANAGNTISGDQSICSGTVPATLTGSLPSGGNGTTYSYLWESATSATGSFSSLSVTTQDYSPPSLTGSRWYRRRVTSGVCAASLSNVVVISVTAALGGNTITTSSPQTICIGSSLAVAGSAPSGGTGTYTYSWESSVTGAAAGFSAVSGGNAQNLTTGPINQNTWFRRVVTSGSCSLTTAALSVVINIPIADNDASGSQTICNNSSPALITGSVPTGGTGTYTYSWERAGTMPGSFGSFSQTGQNLAPGALTQTWWYRRRVTSGVCPSTFSDTVMVTVTPSITGNSITTTTPQTVCNGNTITLVGSAPGGGNGAFTFNWEVSTTSSGSGYAPAPSGNSKDLVAGPLTVNSWYRRQVVSGGCSTTTSFLAVVINQPILNNDAFSSQTICSGTSLVLSGTLPTGGNGTSFAYLWESANALAGPYSNASGTNNAQNYTTGSLTASRWYRRRVTSGVCSATFSDTIAITVTPSLVNNNITASQTVCSGSSPVPFAPAASPVLGGGTGVYTYQWQISTTSASAGFTDIPDATSAGYGHGPLTVNSWFRRVVTSGVCVSTSAALSVTITQPILNNDASASQIICSGMAPATMTGSLPSGGSGVFTYQWLVATSPAGPYNNASGTSNAINYTAGTLTSSRWYTRRVTSGACAATFSDTLEINVAAVVSSNNITASQGICEGTAPARLNGALPGGGFGSFTYRWESSVTSATAGFTVIPDSVGQSFSPPVLFSNIWYRRVVFSGPCVSNSNAVAISVSAPATVNAGPPIPDMVQGGVSGPLGGSFGGAATGAIWTATGGTFTGNSGSTPGTATFQASLISASVVTLTLTSVGGFCPPAVATKTVNVSPDPFGITGVVNAYGEIVGPASLPVGSLICTLAAGEGSRFAKNDRAMIIQMKGANVSLPSSPTDATYGYLTGLNNSGNFEMLNIDSVSGDVVFFQRCIKKAYTTSGRVQLVRVPKYNGDFNIKGSLSVSAVRLTRKGMGYLPNTILTTGFTVTPVQGGIGLQLQARTDDLGQITEVEVLDGGSGYEQPPIISLPDPTEPPYNLPAYKARALAVMGLTARQWNGRTGGILALEVSGKLTMNDSIHMTGMGFAGGMFGDKGDLVPTCGVASQYGLDFFSGYTRSGQKGEGIAAIPSNVQRGKGRYGTGGGGGMEPEGGGGGGANWEDGGRGGSSSYIVITNSICSTSVTPCDKDIARGGLGGGTNPSVPIGLKNVLRANAYNYNPANVRIFLGGGGGGGHAINEFFGLQTSGAGGYGGGIVILKGSTLVSNNLEILVRGERGEAAIGDGAGGGGAGGAILLDFENYQGDVEGRIQGGAGGNAIPTVCEFGYLNFPDRKRYTGAGGGGGGGVIWFSANDDQVTNFLSTGSDIGQSAAGFNEDGLGNSALKGGTSRHQCDLDFVENLPYLGSSFIVGGTSPKPNFTTMAKAAEWLAFKGSDAPSITLLFNSNTDNSTTLRWHTDPATFRQIYTPGCFLGDATLTIRPRTTVNSVNLQNEIDDIQYITLDGVPQVTFKDLIISGSFANTNSGITVKGNSKLVFENVTSSADIRSDNIGNNEITLINSSNTGNLEAGTNQIINVVGTLNLAGSPSYTAGLRLGAGSTFNLPSGTVLNLNGASWINNGAANLNISPASTINFGGNLTNQTIGGTVPTTFRKLNMIGTGQLTINTGPTVGDWNQTGSMVTNTTDQKLTITEKVVTGPGRFTSSGTGSVRLSGPASVDAAGWFDNLEMDSPNGAGATAAIQVDQNLFLTNGKLNTNGFPLTVENPDGMAVTNSATSWVAGALRRRVQASTSYPFPVGSSSKLEKATVNLNAVSGMQYLTASFVPQNGNNHPTASVVTPLQDGPAYFSSLLPDGYWSINPDAGTASYDIWLYPSFYDLYPQYSVYKRPTGGNEWTINGTLDNPGGSINYVQSDGSVRRSGLTGFSDFGIAGGEEPLPLHILDFQAFARRGKARLSWKMGECMKEGRFRIYRGLQPGRLEPVNLLPVSGPDCRSEFESQEALPGQAHTYYYQIEALATGEKPVFSAVRQVNVAENQPDKPFLAVVPEVPGTFRIVNDDIEPSGIRLVAADGKIIAENLRAEDRILDLRSVSKGVYLVEMVNNGWSVRQRIAVGF